MTCPVPLDVLSALGELNRAVRAEGWCNAPRGPVYAYKRHVLETLADAGALICRPVVVSASCRICGGTGRWEDWYDLTCSEPCRRCSASGQVKLRFVVSTLPDGQQWHSPDQQGHTLLHRAWGPLAWDDELGCYAATLPDGTLKPAIYEPVFDWRPGETVKDGPTPDRLAELLNLVEAWMPPPDRWRRFDRHIYGYQLDIGHGLGTTCWHCGEACPDEKPRNGIGSAGHEWLSWSMRAHRDCGHGEPVWPTVPPEDAITPNIRAWLDRRAGVTRHRAELGDW